MTKSAKIPKASGDLLDELVTGNHILSQQKIVDAFGHISVRHDKDPGKFLMSRHLAPGLVSPKDLVTFDLDCNPVANPAKRYYSERFIHGEIYKSRPEVTSVVHCHAPSLIPFGATRTPLKPIFHMSGYLGAGVPVFEIRQSFGMTDMLIRTAERGRALAVSLGDNPMVLMRGHGATMVGQSIKQVVYRAIYATVNAAMQMEALRLGSPTYLEGDEAKLSGERNNLSLDRAWGYWVNEAKGN
ncbi:MAG: class II aldolase/adducin family protein [Stellaceae bacterium]|jgi:HCOMODA/2-hydroxy-3-carboxy-muconic semialdehyde decarboxylase